MNKFVFTSGDTNGIGPEIVIKTLNKLTLQKRKNTYIFICPGNIFEKTANKILPVFSYEIINSIEHKSYLNDVIILNNGTVKQTIGKPTVASGLCSFNSIKESFSMLQSGFADAVITAPISKTAIKKAGVNFPGHTEMFAGWCERKKYAMIFLSKKISVALATIHHPLKNVSNLLKKNKLEDIINIIYRSVQIDLSISSPSIAVLGFNPHAGENGLIGKEEESVIIPVIKRCSRKISVEGPFPPDAFFARKLYKDFDIVLGMYHDQVLIPFKLLNPNGGVNYTAGLPIIRTSPDHGVAYDIAGDYVADESSMIQAFNYAQIILKNRVKNLGS